MMAGRGAADRDRHRGAGGGAGAAAGVAADLRELRRERGGVDVAPMQSMRCSKCGGTLHAAGGRQRGGRAGAVEGVSPAIRRRWSTTTGRGRRSGRSTARSRPTQWRRRSAEAVDAAQERGRGRDGAVIVCRSAAELERMRAAGRAGRRGADRARGDGGARGHDRGSRRDGRGADRRRRARCRRSRAITGTRRRSARRSTTR